MFIIYTSWQVCNPFILVDVLTYYKDRIYILLGGGRGEGGGEGGGGGGGVGLRVGVEGVCVCVCVCYLIDLINDLILLILFIYDFDGCGPSIITGTLYGTFN